MYRAFGEMNWPAPCAEMDDLAWSLRYSPENADLLAAASVIAAYREMIKLSGKRRNEIVRELRLGPNTGRYRAHRPLLIPPS